MKTTNESFFSRLKELFFDVLSFSRGEENERLTVESIKQSVDFKGATLWALIFAVFLASLGLNINSIVVILGAMLIAPLMGPVMGFGLGLGVFDFELIKRSLRYFGVVTFFGVAVSFVFFFIFPYSEAPSSLLLRTQPTIYDVLIALFGGLAGVIACSSRFKANVVSGVAIATALMPPLCTMGFSLATSNFHYFPGALYLYFINSLFISVAAYATARILKFPKKEFLDKNREKRVYKSIVVIVVLTLIPCLIFSFLLFRQSVFERNLRHFELNELNFEETRIFEKETGKKEGVRYANFVMVGKKVPNESIRIALERRKNYDLANVEITVKQGLGQGTASTSSVKSVVLEDLYNERDARVQEQELLIDSLQRRLNYYKEISNLNDRLIPEIRTLFPYVEEISVNYSVISKIDSLQQQGKRDTVALVYLRSSIQASAEERRKITDWLKVRTGQENVRLLWQVSQR